MTNIPQHYVPKHLTKKDKKKQKRELKKSRTLYKKGKYYTRKKVHSFTSKISPHILKARSMYNLKQITPNKALAKATRCTVPALKKIMKKGQGAYFSSGSRPNQTGHSWGYARLASAVTGGKASAIDFNILKNHCKKNSRALRLAKISRKKKIRQRQQVQLGGQYSMKEKIIKFIKPTVQGKKYTAIVENLKTKQQRKISFGAIGYEQYKDSTPLGYYSKNNHNTLKRRNNYFTRHSGVPHKREAIRKEILKSKGYYNPKILSHKYLW